MAEIIKQVKDCTCEELKDCKECPFYWQWRITDDDEVIYDKQAFLRCVDQRKNRTMQQVYNRWKDTLTPEQQIKIQKKLNKKVIVNVKE